MTLYMYLCISLGIFGFLTIFLLIYVNTQSIDVSPSYLGYLTIDYLRKDALMINICSLHVILASWLLSETCIYM